jgi:hypothetical protein
MTNPICPQCATLFVKPVHRESLQERVLSLVYVYPFRCQLCGYRFQYLHWGFKFRKVDEDRRTYQRLPVNLAATFARDGIESQGVIFDLSIVGCAMRTMVKLHSGSILRVLMRAAEDMAPIAIEVGVVRHVQRNRVGVEFLKLKKTDKEQLRQFINKLHQQRKNPPTDLDRQRQPPVH